MKTNWQKRKLNEIAEVSSGNSAPQKKEFFVDGSTPFFRTSDVGSVHLSDNLLDTRDYLNEKCSQGMKLFEPGTILFPKSGASTFLNHRVIMGRDGYVSSHLATITPKTNVLSKFLYYFLNTIDAKEIATNSAYPSLKVSDIGKIETPLPPLEEQKRIVAILDEKLGKIAEAKKLREEALADTEKILSQTLSEIFEEGKKNGWEERELNSVCIKTDNLKWTENKSGQFEYIDLSSVSRESFSITETQTITEKNAPSRAKKVVNENDVIFGTTRPTLMRVTVIPEIYHYQICSTGFCVLRADTNKIIPSFIFYFIQSNLFMDRMEKIQTGASYPAVSDSKVLETLIPLPSTIAEQKEIVKKLDELSARVASLRELQKEQFSDLKKLEKSLLSEAFNGEL